MQHTILIILLPRNFRNTKNTNTPCPSAVANTGTACPKRVTMTTGCSIQVFDAKRIRWRPPVCHLGIQGVGSLVGRRPRKYSRGCPTEARRCLGSLAAREHRNVEGTSITLRSFGLCKGLSLYSSVGRACAS